MGAGSAGNVTYSLEMYPDAGFDPHPISTAHSSYYQVSLVQNVVSWRTVDLSPYNFVAYTYPTYIGVHFDGTDISDNVIILIDSSGDYHSSYILEPEHLYEQRALQSFRNGTRMTVTAIVAVELGYAVPGEIESQQYIRIPIVLQCRIPLVWFYCNPESWWDGTTCNCDCTDTSSVLLGKVSPDPDCRNLRWNYGWVDDVHLESKGCREEPDAYCNAFTFQCSILNWNCSFDDYNTRDACNCGCGVPDPDCNVSALVVEGCEDDFECRSGRCVKVDKINIAAIVGGVVGGALGLALLMTGAILGGLFIWRRGYQGGIDGETLSQLSTLKANIEMESLDGCRKVDLEEFPLEISPQPPLTFGLKGHHAPVGEALKEVVTITNPKKHKKKAVFRVVAPPSEKYTLEVSPDCGEIDPDFYEEVTVSLTFKCTTIATVSFPIILLKESKSGKMTGESLVMMNFSIQSALSTSIDFDELTLDSPPVGEGSFGVVHAGYWRGRKVAVKVLKDQAGKSSTQEFQHEISILERLRCPQIVEFIGAVKIPGKLAIITEFMEMGNLSYCMTKTKFSRLLKVKCLLDCSRAMQFLHNNDLIHRDLKPDNLLMCSLEEKESVNCKLTDFGTSREIERSQGTQYYTAGVGTPVYMAPELLSNGKYNKKADVYSFALVAHYTFAEKQPFSELATAWSDVGIKNNKTGHHLIISLSISNKKFSTFNTTTTIVTSTITKYPPMLNRPVFTKKIINSGVSPSKEKNLHASSLTKQKPWNVDMSTTRENAGRATVGHDHEHPAIVVVASVSPASLNVDVAEGRGASNSGKQLESPGRGSGDTDIVEESEEENENENENQKQDSGDRSEDGEKLSWQHLSLGICMSIICMSISFIETMIVPAVPVITEAYPDQSEWAPWVLSIYLMTGGISTPLFTAFSIRFGFRASYGLCLGFYILGSTGCSVSFLSSNLALLIISRGFQGLGMTSYILCISFVNASFPKKYANIMIGVLSAMYPAGASLGLIGGGAALDYISFSYNGQSCEWVVLFWIITPIVSVVCIAILLSAKDPPINDGTNQVDFIGALLLGVAVGAFLVGLTLLDQVLPEWGDEGPILLLCSSPVFLGMFIVWELIFRKDKALIPPRLLLDRALFILDFAIFSAGYNTFTQFITIPSFLKEENGFFAITSSLIVGLILFPEGIPNLIVSPLSPHLVKIYGGPNVFFAFFFILFVSMFIQCFLHETLAQLIFIQILSGIGSGGVFTLQMILIAGATEKHTFMAAAGVGTLFKIIGSAIAPVVSSVLINDSESARSASESSSGSWEGEMGYVYSWAISAGLLGVSLVLLLFLPHQFNHCIDLYRRVTQKNSEKRSLLEDEKNPTRD
ncbi:bicyclomycin/multidrug efflux system [Pelomyxa schiedti]|nr:bicyclomycin/multidrug efflux system [Pelomyxa schiedti]